MWDANFLQKHHKSAAGRQLFKSEPVKFALPHLAQHPLDEAIDQIEIFGFPLCNAFELADDDVTQYATAKNIGAHLGKGIKMLGYLITTKEVRTTNNNVMVFGTFTDVNGDWLDTVHFPDALRKNNIGGKGFYRLHGTVVEDFGVFSLDVKFCQKVGIKDRSAAANTLVSGNLHNPIGK